MQDNELYMIQGTEYEKMTGQILEKADLAARIPSPSCRIGIKPNLVSPSDPSMGATTHTEIVAGLVAYLRGHGFHNLVVLESAWVGAHTADVLAETGLGQWMEEHDVAFLDLQKDGSHSVNCRGMQLTICNAVDTIDFLINVPVMKGHCQTKITCALKNMKGMIPNSEKRRFHKMGLHKPIAHLNTAIHQDFILVDSICGDWDFEEGGNPVVLNKIMAAADPVLVDAYVADLMGYEKEEVQYLALAEKLGLGSADLHRLHVVQCNEFTDVRFSDRHRKLVDVQDVVEEVESCSACYGYLIPVLDRLRREGLLDKLHGKIAIGQGYRGEQGTLGIGNCTRRFVHSLSGCPPMPDDMYQFLRDYIEDQ